MEDFTIALQAFVAAAIFFVWVVRYPNIINEFKQYALPEWLRDLVGVLKLSFALLLLIGINHRRLAIAGAAGIALLMERRSSPICGLGIRHSRCCPH